MKKYRNWIIAAVGVLLWAAGFGQVRADVAGVLGYVCIGLGCGLFGHGSGELIAQRALKSDPALQKQLEIAKTTSVIWPSPARPRAAPSI